MSNQHTWSISDAKTTNGETMIVGGPGQEFGLIAVVTDEADAKQIIADREARASAPCTLDGDNMAREAVANAMATKRRELQHMPLERIWGELAEAALAHVLPSTASSEKPVAYVPVSKASGELLWRETFAAKWLHKGTWQGFELQPLYTTPTPSDAMTATPVENQRSISAWCHETFGLASSNARVAARANEEMAELLRALTTDENHSKAIEEAADVVIILYRLADRMGMDLHAEIDCKMQINRKREWRVSDGHGYHVRPGSGAASRNDRGSPAT